MIVEERMEYRDLRFELTECRTLLIKEKKSHFRFEE